jgi:hypothetical protein
MRQIFPGSEEPDRPDLLLAQLWKKLPHEQEKSEVQSAQTRGSNCRRRGISTFARLQAMSRTESAGHTEFYYLRGQARGVTLP